MRKIIHAIAGAGATVAALTALPATAAHAAAPVWYHGAAPNGCAYGSLCVYRDIDFNPAGYPVANIPGSVKDWRVNYSWVAEEDSSWYNNGTPDYPSSVIIYATLNWHGGYQLCLDRGWGARYFSDLNDNSLSNKWVGGC
ncbi:hypothetical protein [Actinomadura terrae]|uniref:hypothetical protein n=1 Tax=Actinomadura terrae TaxID=604353 RepID=UPI001FA700BC|nr:hypothetical protein [Actinomadura terrae]